MSPKIYDQSKFIHKNAQSKGLSICPDIRKPGRATKSGNPLSVLS